MTMMLRNNDMSMGLENRSPGAPSWLNRRAGLRLACHVSRARRDVPTRGETRRGNLTSGPSPQTRSLRNPAAEAGRKALGPMAAPRRTVLCVGRFHTFRPRGRFRPRHRRATRQSSVAMEHAPTNYSRSRPMLPPLLGGEGDIGRVRVNLGEGLGFA